MTEILNQIPSLSFIWQLAQDGFFLGALTGAVLGTLIWTIMERNSFGLIPMTVTALIGLLLGIYLEGDIIRSLGGQEWETFFSSSVAFRSEVFESVLRIISWTLGLMIIGAIISNYKLALSGFVIGTICGTFAGILIYVLGSELGYPVDSPITALLLAIISIVLLVLVSMSRERDY